jgi:putative transposase
MHVHRAFVSQCRRGVFTKAIPVELRGILSEVCAKFDDEHLLVNCPPKVSVSARANSVNGVSNRMIGKKNYPSIRRKLGRCHEVERSVQQ